MISLLEHIIDSARNLDVKDKLYIILLLGAVIRAPFYFVNFDSRVYQLWLQLFLENGSLPYVDHPPVFFVVSGVFEFFFSHLQGINPYLYWWVLFLPLGYLYYRTREKSPFLLILLSFLTLYTWFVGFFGNLYEIGTLASYFGGIALIYLSYCIGERQNETIGLYAALFTALAWWPIVYSKTLIIDSFAAAVIAGSYLLYDKFLREEEPSRNLWIVTTFVLTIAFYTKYYALLIIPVIGLYALYTFRNSRKLVIKAIPGLVAVLLFGVWAFITDFYFLQHYAATHYMFLTMPSPLAFGKFFWISLTPLLLGLSLFGINKLYSKDAKETVFLLLPIATALAFHMFQVFAMKRSHSLINLTNYLLYTFPMIAAVAASGWSNISFSFKYKWTITSLVALTFLFLLMNPTIGLEYDKNYLAPQSSNINSLTASQLEEAGLDSIDTLHYVYSFKREPMFVSNYEPKKSHFRWISPTKIKILTSQPINYSLKLTPTNDRDKDLILLRNGEKTKEINLSSSKWIRLDNLDGKVVFEFKSGNVIPFISSDRILREEHRR